MAAVLNEKRQQQQQAKQQQANQKQQRTTSSRLMTLGPPYRFCRILISRLICDRQGKQAQRHERDGMDSEWLSRQAPQPAAQPRS